MSTEIPEVKESYFELKISKNFPYKDANGYTTVNSDQLVVIKLDKLNITALMTYLVGSPFNKIRGESE